MGSVIKLILNSAVKGCEIAFLLLNGCVVFIMFHLVSCKIVNYL